MKYRNQIVCCLPLLLALAGCHAAPDTPLTVAATEGRIQEVQTLLERGADPNAKDS